MATKRRATKRAAPKQRSSSSSKRKDLLKVPASYKRYLRVALNLPGTEESTSYGTPSVKVKGKFLSRLRTESEGALALLCDFIDREMLLQADPEVFFITDHYRDYP